MGIFPSIVISPANSIKGKFCSCGSKYEAYITEADDTKIVLNRCICCDYTNNSNGILRNFYVGQDAATSVAATSLYNVIPSSVKRIRKIKSVIFDTQGMLVKTLPLMVSGENREMMVEDFIKDVDRSWKESLVHSNYSYTALSEEYQLKP